MSPLQDLKKLHESSPRSEKLHESSKIWRNYISPLQDLKELLESSQRSEGTTSESSQSISVTSQLK